MNLDAELDKEAARWQERIADVIRRSGLPPFDASGNESGDPLDYTADQVERALSDSREKTLELAARFAGRWVSETFKDDVEALELEDAIRALIEAP